MLVLGNVLLVFVKTGVVL